MSISLVFSVEFLVFVCKNVLLGKTPRQMNKYLHGSTFMVQIAFKAIVVMPSLLQQKPSQKSRSK